MSSSHIPELSPVFSRHGIASNGTKHSDNSVAESQHFWCSQRTTWAVIWQCTRVVANSYRWSPSIHMLTNRVVRPEVQESAQALTLQYSTISSNHAICVLNQAPEWVSSSPDLNGNVRPFGPIITSVSFGRLMATSNATSQHSSGAIGVSAVQLCSTDNPRIISEFSPNCPSSPFTCLLLSDLQSHCLTIFHSKRQSKKKKKIIVNMKT